MPKRKKPEPSRPARPLFLNQVQTGGEELDIIKEVDYIVQRAQENDGRIVRMDALVFFSTATGDAWILDIEDKLALCLARAGEKQLFTIRETATTYGIVWSAQFSIEDERFIVTEHSGQTRTILGYPTQELLQTIRHRQ